MLVRKQAEELSSGAVGAVVDAATPPWVRCRQCQHKLAHRNRSAVFESRQRHTCVNPAGLVFRVALFSEAAGVFQVGDWHAEHSWFAGYRWQIACCANCDAHVGWVFLAEDLATEQFSPFFALIEDRIELT